MTAEKLNHMEDGIAEANSGDDVFVLTYDNTTQECSCTFAELLAAYNAGKLLRAKFHDAAMGGTTDIVMCSYEVMGMYGTIQAITFGFINNIASYHLEISQYGITYGRTVLSEV